MDGSTAASGMTRPIIEIENIGKRYLIGTHKEPYLSLRHEVARAFSISARRNRATEQEFWALRNINFSIREGEVIGIIGRNGAGKSTLLKILSQITPPTEGSITMRGRVASLLEVGTGFHPELTGRENIFLNGAILGMKRAEIIKKFDAIVAFAEIDRFIDTPVKRYSSGMYVRLAFAVAAHLDPEILLVDEILAVGDAEFQKKCLGRMGEVAKRGRTVIFVSHDMRKVTSLCEHGILLNAGQIEAEGAMTDLAGIYLQGRTQSDGFADLSQRGDRSGNGEAQFQTIELLKGRQRSSAYAFGEALAIRTTVKVKQRLAASLLDVMIKCEDGISVHELCNVNEGYRWVAEPGIYEFTITIPELRLYPGTYSIDLWMGTDASARVDYITNALNFHIVQTPVSKLAWPLDRSNGLVFQSSEWKCDKMPFVNELSELGKTE